MKKIIISLAIVLGVAAIAGYGTYSFFSDKETSTGNTFTAGALDLKVDSTCHYDGMVCNGSFVWAEEFTGSSTFKELIGQPCSCTWFSKDLSATDIFFKFTDVKPGDIGENTISLTLNNNPAWACASVSNLSSTVGTCNEPKCKAQNGTWDPANNTCSNPTCSAQLQNKLLFTLWKDKNCNNIYDAGDDTYIVQNQPASAVSNWAIADSTTGGQPLSPGDNGKTCIGVKWSIDPATGNEIQGDNVKGDISFTVTQSRNNAGFTCASLNNSIVRVSNLQPNYDATGAGGVYSAYYGPPNHSSVSPGSTAIYDGRQAGIIKAGQGNDPGVGTPPNNYNGWDEGLFAVIPNVTINALSAGALTYDVETQFGVNPVWMTIEIDTGVVGDRSDNTTYQFVPTTNPAGWHTVNAGAGQWQKWNNNNGDTTGSPLISLSQIATAHNGLNVVRTYLRLGMGSSYYNGGTGTTAWVDKMAIGGKTYDFVL